MDAKKHGRALAEAYLAAGLGDDTDARVAYFETHSDPELDRPAAFVAFVCWLIEHEPPPPDDRPAPISGTIEA